MLFGILCMSGFQVLLTVALICHVRELKRGVRATLKKVITMADVNDQILAKLGDLETAVASENAEIDKLAAELKATPPDDPRGQQILDRISALTASVSSKVASVSSPAA